ncbi:hypothetical protein [Alkanindiges hydrocarboniclasticus]|uniref:hypothetical protein n=1 Tax=Alkanindiges hydrocarboniclasticus TaxID=1907941 RepID=UPI001177D335|nr:hypothetical protein [Alkanindiges hydrocarboniclasticus]
MINRIVLASVVAKLLFLSPNVFAISASEAVNQGKALSTSEHTKVSDTDFKTVVPNYSANVSEASTYNTSKIPNQQGAALKNYCNTTSLDSMSEEKRQQCNAINLTTYNSKVQGTFKLDPKTDPLLILTDKFLKAQKNNPNGISLQCDPDQPIKTKGQVASCNATTKNTIKRCVTPLNMTCASKSSNTCSGVGGINPDKIIKQDSEGSFTYANNILTFGIGSGQGSGYRKATFKMDIEDVKETEIFELQTYYYDNGTRLSINGQEVLAANWYASNDDYSRSPVSYIKDLKPYLVSGNNEVVLENRNHAGPYQSSVTIKAKENCPCTESWGQETCVVETCLPKTVQVCNQSTAGICSASGGILASTFKLDSVISGGLSYTLSLSNGVLVVGATSDSSNYDLGEKVITYSFDLKNAAALGKFSLKKTAWDDGIQILINNQLVRSNGYYVHHRDEVSSSNEITDLRPFLKDGKNTLTLKTFNVISLFNTRAEFDVDVACDCYEQEDQNSCANP